MLDVSRPKWHVKDPSQQRPCVDHMDIRMFLEPCDQAIKPQRHMLLAVSSPGTSAGHVRRSPV